MNGKKLLICLAFFGITLLGRFLYVSAQSRPDVVVTWNASSYAPGGYPGKILPSVGSTIRVSFEALSDGKFLNLSKQMIYWYLNDDLIASGEGVQDIVFKAVQA